MVASGIAIQIAIMLWWARDSGWSKLEVTPGGGRNAGVGVAAAILTGSLSYEVMSGVHIDEKEPLNTPRDQSVGISYIIKFAHLLRRLYYV